MLTYYMSLVFFLSVVTAIRDEAVSFLRQNYIECGPYGFICEGTRKLRLCEANNLFGPAFNCPPNTICNEESADVCDNSINYIDPMLRRTLRCHRSERIVDPNVPGCRGYILCIPNKSRFQGIKFKCAGNTIFNGYTRTCSSPEKYKCPMSSVSTTTPKLFDTENSRMDVNNRISSPANRHRPIDCKNYKFTVTQDNTPIRATFFCPPRPVRGESSVRCTIFSNQFCITLERDDEDQFIEKMGASFRIPRVNVNQK